MLNGENKLTREKLGTIAYLSHDSLIEGIGSSQILPIVIGASRKGWNVVLLTCEKNTDFSTKSELAEMLKANGITWIKLKFGRIGALGGLGRLVRISLKIPKADFYHCRGDLVATALRLSNRKARYLWDVRGLWVQQKVIIGTLQDKGIVNSLTLKLEIIAAKHAFAVTTLTQALQPILKKKYQFLTENMYVVPTCTDLELFKFSRKLPKVTTLVLSGVFNNYYDLDQIRKFIEKFRIKKELTVIWAKAAESQRKELDVGEDSIVIKRQREMPEIIKMASFGLAICKEDVGESLAGVMPTKIAEFLATGRPVVVSSGLGDLTEMLKEFKAGITLGPDLNDGILELIDILEDENTPGRCRALALKYFDINNAVETYHKIYLEGILGSE